MDPQQLQAFREALESQRRALADVAEAGRAASATVILDQSSVGRLSRMDALQGQAMAQASQRRRDEQLRRILRALARMEAGDYGYCLDCDEAIAVGRLHSDPAVERCVSCAAEREDAGLSRYQ